MGNKCKTGKKQTTYKKVFKRSKLLLWKLLAEVDDSLNLDTHIFVISSIDMGFLGHFHFFWVIFTPEKMTSKSSSPTAHTSPTLPSLLPSQPYSFPPFPPLHPFFSSSSSPLFTLLFLPPLFTLPHQQKNLMYFCM